MSIEKKMETEIEMSNPNKNNDDNKNQNNEEKEEEEEEEYIYFEGSTHTWLVYLMVDTGNNEDKCCMIPKSKISYFILGIITIGIQCLLYGMMSNEGMGELQFNRNDGLPTPVLTGVKLCPEDGGYINASKLICGSEPPDQSKNNNEAIGAYAVACILVVYFISKDLIECFNIWFTMKGKGSIFGYFMAIIIFCEAIFAFYVGTVYAFISAEEGSAFDAILNCIGVLFVHDLDEQLFETVEFIQIRAMKGQIWKKFEKITCGCCKQIDDNGEIKYGCFLCFGIDFRQCFCIIFTIGILLLIGNIIVGELTEYAYGPQEEIYLTTTLPPIIIN